MYSLMHVLESQDMSFKKKINVNLMVVLETKTGSTYCQGTMYDTHPLYKYDQIPLVFKVSDAFRSSIRPLDMVCNFSELMPLAMVISISATTLPGLK